MSKCFFDTHYNHLTLTFKDNYGHLKKWSLVLIRNKRNKGQQSEYEVAVKNYRVSK